MKQALYLVLILIAIPLFAILLLYQEESEKPKTEEKEFFVRVKRETSNKIDIVELEEYVAGVLAGEMPIYFHIEALKAQAVAARSYVLKRMEYNEKADYDVVDSVANQVYYDEGYLRNSWKNGYDDNMKKIMDAVTQTAYQYISYNDKIADALFFSTSNGFTENSEDVFSSNLPYLKSVESMWDKKTSPVFNDKKTYDISVFLELLNLANNNDLKIEVLKRTSTGRIIKLKINGVEMLSSDVRNKLKLRSTDFEIIKAGEIVEIKTSGYGHGVGMSQYGALGMANEGYLYDEILKHYYKDVEIRTLK